MPGTGLLLHDTISVKSQGGDCNIELLLGDITKLKLEDKVDVIFVSSFQDDYIKNPGTVIGALYENLGVDVEELSQDKEEDLRSLYSCWYSKPLPSKIPYDRLLCFESRSCGAGRPQELIGHAFRCLVPIVKNKDSSIITPLLSSGDQHYDPVAMLDGIIHAAISWVKAGLPIRLLKIVVYAAIEDGEITFLRGVDSEILERFAELKTRYESANLIPQEVTLEYDVCLSYSDKDQGIADKIQTQLLLEKPNIRICTARQKMDTEVVYQEEMYDMVSKSARVITGHEWQRTLYHSIDGSSCMIAIISPKYLKSAVCMEEYSLAQIKHLSQDTLHLIPVCICDGIETDFSQISHIPMLDARPGVYDKAINSICSSVVSWLETSSFDHPDKLLKKNKDNQVDVPDMMEKFRAARFWEEYRDTFEKAKIFPPTMEKLKDLREKTETSGGDQVEVKEAKGREYEVKERSKEEGGRDKEEKADAKAKEKIIEEDDRREERSGKQDGSGKELPVGQKVKDEQVELKGGEKGEPQSGEEKASVNVGNKEKADDTSESKIAHSDEGNQTVTEKSVTIVFSYHQTDVKFVYLLKELITWYAPHLVLKSDFATDQERLDSLEAADNIIALLSPHYIESPEHVEEFHIGLWRQRVSPEEAPLLVPIQVAVLPKRPTYFQLVGYPVNTWDGLWADLLGVQNVKSPVQTEVSRLIVGMRRLPMISPDELHPMTEAAQVLISSIKAKRSVTMDDPPRVRPALVNTVRLQKELLSLTGKTAPSLDKCLVDVPLPDRGYSCTIL